MTAPQQRKSPLPRVLWDDEWEGPEPDRRPFVIAGASLAFVLIGAGAALVTRGVWEPDTRHLWPPAAPRSAMTPEVGKPGAVLVPRPMPSPEDPWEPNDVVASPRPTRPPSPPRSPRRLAAPLPDRRTGYLSINSTPWAELSVDGRVVGSTPQVKIRVTPGRHHVVLVREGFQTHSAWVEVAAGGTVRVTDIALKEVGQ